MWLQEFKCFSIVPPSRTFRVERNFRHHFIIGAARTLFSNRWDLPRPKKLSDQGHVWSYKKDKARAEPSCFPLGFLSLASVCSEPHCHPWVVTFLMSPFYLILLHQHTAICYRSGTLIMQREGRRRPEGPSHVIAAWHMSESGEMPAQPRASPTILPALLSTSTSFNFPVLLVTSLQRRRVLHEPDNECYFILYVARPCFFFSDHIHGMFPGPGSNPSSSCNLHPSL